MRPSQPWYRTSHDAWYVEIGGRQVKLARGKANKQAAMLEWHRLQSGQGHPGDVAEPQVAVVFDLFLSWSKRHHTPESYEWYRHYLQSFVSFRDAGRLVVSKVTVSTVTTWMDAQKSWTDSSRRGAVTAVKRAFAWAEAEGYTKLHPVKHLKKPGAVSRTRVLSKAERTTVLAAIRDESFRRFVHALQETGCRPSEVARLTAADVDLEAGVWTLHAHKTAKKTGKPRVVYLTPAMAELTRALAERYPTGPLFRSARTGRAFSRNAIRIRFMRLRQKFPELSGVTAYTYRHSFATDALENGVGIAQVAELLGHSSTDMVMKHYSKLSQRVQHLREMASRAVGGLDT
ncbi:MAG: site-specific integrase [Gemmataceae bacterium]